MLEELLRHNKLGLPSEIKFLLADVLYDGQYHSLSDVKDHCINRVYGFGNSFDGALKLLQAIGFVKITDQDVKSSYNEYNGSNSDVKEIFVRLFQLLEGENSLVEFFPPSSLQYNSTSEEIAVRQSFIPIQYNAIRKLLVDFCLFEENTISSNLLTVQKGYEDIFINAINKINSSSVRSPFTQKELENLKKRQAEIGLISEKFVLDYEIKRLNGHIFLAKVKRVSEENVSAGYDIVSFNSLSSLVADRFIEVKTLTKDGGFYWSRNEVEVAQKIKSLYYLYLVDRDRFTNEGYSPIIIQNPHKVIFLYGTEGGWHSAPDNWYILSNKKG